MGTLGVILGRLYDIWKCMGTLGVMGVVYMRFGKCMRTLGVIVCRSYKVWEVYGDPRGS